MSSIYGQKMRDDIEFNVQFCEIIEQYPALYDQTRPEYSNKCIQDKIWREIGLKVDATAKDCKERWKNIRCSYSKNKKNMNAPSGSSTKTCKEYYLSPHLRFLDNFLKSRPPKGNLYQNIDRIEDEDDLTSMSAGSSASEPQVAGSSAGELQETDFITPQPTPPPKNKTQISLSDVNKTAFEYFTQKKQQIKTKEQNMDDSNADMAFLRSMLPDVNTMTQDQKRKFKIGVLNLIEQILNEPTSQTSRTSYSRSSLRSESPYQRTPSRESVYNSPTYVGSCGNPTPQQTHKSTTGTYGGPALQETQPASQQTHTQMYLPMSSPGTPVLPPSHETFKDVCQPHDDNQLDFNKF